MSFFYNLNKRLADLSAKQDTVQLAESKQAQTVAQSPLTQALNESNSKKVPDLPIDKKGIEKHYGGSVVKMGSAAKDAGFSDARIRQTGEKFLQGKLKEEEMDEAGYSAKAARAGKDIGKPGKAFAKIAKSAGEKYGSKAAGERVAGAVLNKLRHPKESACMADEGNAFTGALAKTPKGGKFKVGNKEFTDTSSIEEADVLGQFEEGYAEMDAWLKNREKEKGTGKFDVKDTGYSKRYTRKHEEEPEDDGEEMTITIKKKGRKKVGAGKGKKIGAKVKGTSKLHKLGSIAEDGEYDAEGEMAKGQIHTIVRHAKELESILHDNENLPEWVQEKLGQIKGMMTTVADYMLSNREQGIEQHTGEEGITIVPEVAPPGAKAERMVKHIKKGYSKDGKLTPKEKSIAYATAWKAHNAGKVEEEGGDKPDYIDLDKDGDKKEPMKQAAKQERKQRSDKEADANRKRDPRKTDKKEEVDETTTSGSVATASAAPKSSKGMQFGKGVYESLDAQYKQALTESITVQETVAECGMPGLAPEQGITIQASGEDAIKLMQLLKLAGLAGGEESCPSCGHSPCDCDSEMVDENSPDWPTNTETKDADPQLRTYSGGLNGPKSSGQSTTIGGGLPNLDPRRQVSMEESVKLEKTLSDLYKNYKG